MAALDLASLAGEIDRANVRGDAGALEMSRSALGDALAGSSGDEACDYRYALAYVDYRLAILAGRGTKESERYLGEAEQELEKLREERPATRRRRRSTPT